MNAAAGTLQADDAAPACSACMYYAERYAGRIVIERLPPAPPDHPDELVQTISDPGRGDCRRRAPGLRHENRYPYVRGDHWCGQFKAKASSGGVA
jgi:hypothetical protein